MTDKYKEPYTLACATSQILSEKALDEVQDIVIKLIGDGYEPVGGICLNSYTFEITEDLIEHWGKEENGGFSLGETVAVYEVIQAMRLVPVP
jgi:hypothetical protein